MEITLTGKTQKGKNRVREHGNLWTIFSVNESVLFTKDKGPWLFIFPKDTTPNHKAARWVHKTSDLDFSVSEKE